jgi:hypothetical protein
VLGENAAGFDRGSDLFVSVRFPAGQVLIAKRTFNLSKTKREWYCFRRDAYKTSRCFEAILIEIIAAGGVGRGPKRICHRNYICGWMFFKRGQP